MPSLIARFSILLATENPVFLILSAYFLFKSYYIGALAFEDDFGKLQFITREELLGMCGALALHNQPECVFLCACFAQTVADAFVELGIKHVVTVTSDFILDKV
jgi:hypothetical protein